MLDWFFVTNVDRSLQLEGGYNYILVAASFLVATLASYLALILARYLSVPQKQDHRRMLQWGGALALGAGIWSMHFIGMLAFNMDMSMGYEPFLTIVSLVVAVLSAYAVLHLVSRPELKGPQILIGAFFLGIGISAMHFIGMEAMVMDATIRFEPGMFALSIFIGMAASGAALWIAFNLARHTGTARKWLNLLAALVMAVAICGMHYTGMAAAVFTQTAEMDMAGHSFSASGVALGVAIIGIILSIVLPIIVYQTIRDDQEGDEDTSAFPTKLLSLTVVCTFAVLIGLAWYSYHLSSYRFTSGNVGNSVAINLKLISWIAISSAILLAIVWFFAFSSIKRWRRELRDNKAVLRTILNNMPLALFAKDAAHDFKWLFMNNKAADMLAVPNKNVAGLGDSDFVSAEEAAKIREKDVSIMEGGKLVDVEAEKVTTPTGTFIAHTIRVPIYDEKGQPHILLGMYEDVTERVRSKEELRLAKERAERADQAKSEFLANMSHELRTPLNSIMGMTRLLNESDITEEQQVLTSTVLTSSSTLLEIVNDILDLSKIEAGAVELEQIGFDMSYVLQSVIDRLNPLAREKKLPPIELVNPALVPYVLGDPTRVSRVLTNLISNAIKYTDEGKIVIKVSHFVDGNEHIRYRCDVTDSGIGIPPEKHATIFQKFVQADTSTTRKYGGTGLGLAITKQLVELMGGTIGIESAAGHGSTFWFELPFAVTTQLYREKTSDRKAKVYNSLKPAVARVLVAEDHPMNQAFIKKLLPRFGFTNFKIVANGLEAVDMYKSGYWDIILMDCHMPEMNGYDATVEIRNMEKTSGQHVPIIAMTANAMVGDREKCLKFGMDDYISKPIVMEEMVKIIGQWVDFGEAKQEFVVEKTEKPIQCIDLSQMHELSEGDIESERELIKMFIQQSDINLETLGANQINGVSTPWIEACHMLKGSSSSLGAKELSHLCAAGQLMETATAEARTQLLLDIHGAYTRVKEALRAEKLCD